jgi:hypothetical protein
MERTEKTVVCRERRRIVSALLEEAGALDLVSRISEAQAEGLYDRIVSVVCEMAAQLRRERSG